jgi:tripartite-type tricarboxylate transporter receptor subunit TctC
LWYQTPLEELPMHYQDCSQISLWKILGQSVIVENKPGAAGNIAAEYIYNADADGYTLFASPPRPSRLMQIYTPN